MRCCPANQLMATECYYIDHLAEEFCVFSFRKYRILKTVQQSSSPRGKKVLDLHLGIVALRGSLDAEHACACSCMRIRFVNRLVVISQLLHNTRRM